MKLSKQCQRVLSLLLAILFLATSMPSSVYASEISVSPEAAYTENVDEADAQEAETAEKQPDAQIQEDQPEVKEEEKKEVVEQSADKSENIPAVKSEGSTDNVNTADDNTTGETDYRPVITSQPQSIAAERSSIKKATLTVEATTTKGELSYQWYQVGEDSTATKLTSATSSSYKASCKKLGIFSYYCEVTNTVNGEKYSVNTDTVTVTVHNTYLTTLEITKDDQRVFYEYGTWPGKTFDESIELDAASAYKLTMGVTNLTMISTYSMTVSYNGEEGEVEAFPSNREVILDTSKFTAGKDGYFTIQVGNYDTAKQAYISSELYRFNVTMEADYRPVITSQPQSIAAERSSIKKATLTVEATTTKGELSYQWYQVGEDSTATKLTSATSSSYKASCKKLGIFSYYCEVTNTVNGEKYSVNTDTVTVTVHNTYLTTLEITKDDQRVFYEYGTWPGKTFDESIELDAASAYKLTMGVTNLTMISTYSMTVSYNGEEGEVEAFPSNREVILDTSKFTAGKDGYFTIQVGNYDTAKQAYISSELYRFNVTMEADYRPVITSQPQSIAAERSSIKKATLTVEATTTKGELSYQWYKVGETEDEKLSDEQATTNTYEASLRTLGSSSYYCIVTNTVDGQTYTCKSEIATVTTYKKYLQCVTICANDNVVTSKADAKWPGETYDIAINDRDDYDIRPIWASWGSTNGCTTTITYNEEAGVREAFKSPTTFDASKFPYGTGGRFQIEVGELDKNTDDYISSIKYGFNIYKFPGMKALNVSENGTALSLTTDLCSALNMQKTQTKTTQAVKSNAVTVQVTPNQDTTKVYIGNATEAATEATINPADYPKVYDGQYPYAVVPVKLVAPNGTVRIYSLLTQIKVTRIKVNKHPADVTCYDGDKVSLEVAAKSLDGGTLSYQWYKVAESGDELIDNAVKATFEPVTDTVGESSYYCVITDTLNETTYSVKSNIATGKCERWQ